jgi:chromosome segregation ATPase
MYKCKDEKGKVYYSDKMYTDCTENSEITKQGRVIEKPKPAKTEVDKTKKDSGPPKPELTRDQKRRDEALLATYTSAAEIDLARDRSLAVPLQGIKASEAKLDKTGKQLNELKKQADALASKKQPLPAHLTEEVQQKQNEITALEADIAQRKANVDAINARYDRDKIRFVELSSAK